MLLVIFDLVVFDLGIFDPFTVCNDASCFCILLIWAPNDVVFIVSPPACPPPCLPPHQPVLLVLNLLLMTEQMDSSAAFANFAMDAAKLVFRSST